MNINSNKKVLFIVWDAPHVNYLEGLFVPIFGQLVDQYGYEFHVVQFSWLSKERIKHLSSICQKKNIHYTHIQIMLGPFAFLGKYVTLFKGSRILKNYINKFRIDIVMPRSNMPAKMVLSALRGMQNIKVIFDADGLPIEERVDFAGLEKNSFRYKALKQIERNILNRADRVITRSKKAIQVLLQYHKLSDEFKFDVVKNGRDIKTFKRSEGPLILKLKKQLGLPQDAFVLVYCGSLGPQYGIEEMMYIHQKLYETNNKVFLLLIVTNPEFVQKSSLERLPNVFIKSVNFAEVPDYLSLGDVALAIRKPTFSMQGVAPIKLGEYLLMGLPTVASSGIGDTDEILSGQDYAYVLKDHSHESLDQAIQWINAPRERSVMDLARAAGEQYFSLEACVKSYVNALQKLN